MKIYVPARRYEDADDSLAAAALEFAERHGLAGWDLAPAWASDDREEIALTVPEWLEIGRFVAVAGQDAGTCEALQWRDVGPLIRASGDDADDVLAEAIERCGHDDVRVYDRERERFVRFD